MPPSTRNRVAPKTDAQRSRLMSRVRQSGTAFEQSLAAILTRLGVKYSTIGKGLPGTPDFFSESDRWAIFVHGCFWHRHRGCKKSKIPRSNREFWKRKFSDNRRRDRRKAEELSRQGYRVLSIWACELEAPLLVDRLRAFIALTGLPRERFEAEAGRVTRIVKTIDAEVRTSLSLDRAVPFADPADKFDWALLRSKIRLRSARTPAVRVVDLFSGCGGFSLGAAAACDAVGRQFQPVLAVDNSQPSLDVYKANFAPLFAERVDISTILDGDLGAPATVAERALAAKVGSVNLLLAGPPCQGHSDLNNHTRRDDARNRLYERVARFVEVVEPDSVLIENVAGVVHAKDRCVDKTIAALEAAGYNVSTGLVDLTAIGVPQRRRRHLLVAAKAARIDVAAVVEKYRVAAPRTVRWAIGDLGRDRGPDVFVKPATLTKENRERVDYLFEHRVFDLPNSVRPKCHQNDDHSYRSMYGRLRSSRPAQTITSGFGCPGQGRFVHPTARRTLTAHEAARLQFFPDYFDFGAAKRVTDLRLMIGNAVPMKLSYIFTLELLGQAFGSERGAVSRHVHAEPAPAL